MAIFLVNKKIGETPLMVIQKIRKIKKISKDVSMTYAGRLDPAAEGALLVLSEKDVYKKEKFSALGKTYKIKIIFGVKTDTGDLLGLAKEKKSKTILEEKLFKATKRLIGKRYQRYQSFSSKEIHGVPLWKISRNKKVTTPKHFIEIKSIKILEEEKIQYSRILSRLQKIFKKISGDFRQKEILKSWQKIKSSEFQSFTLQIICGSGVYMRVLAEEIGEKLNSYCVCFSIERTKINNTKKYHLSL